MASCEEVLHYAEETVKLLEAAITAMDKEPHKVYHYVYIALQYAKKIK